ncbi:release factor glutamine methyltransferase [Litchfieldella qijiaojingensis]|uniref:Release factor glutamine methyltransferase n=1 Tax=Litchfieldella qijiaojingensis TaxID=980347 RepID=A0ABQ2YFR4_9GAMM|nr:peptide chain release factor N(5)-glutamine methyltransferase [Halomonas qijiaojingensis]GGX82177.1 release factor glutamine methyltransferase [Halomonas qijiaojingensis]
MRLDTLLKRAAGRLEQAGSPSPRLDAEVLLCHVLGVERSWLYTWGDRHAESFSWARFEALVAARAEGQPVAYLVGEREFWGLRLATTPATLIPRPDTETLVAAALEKATSGSGRLLDLGTGTGAIALAFAIERPGWEVLGVDREPAAVALATDNAARHGIANARFRVGDWFNELVEERFDLIVSNPPYIADDDPHLGQGDVRFEPRSALVAGEAGLADLHALVRKAASYLAPSGWLLLEHGLTQGEDVRRALHGRGYREVATLEDLGGRERVSLGHAPLR